MRQLGLIFSLSCCISLAFGQDPFQLRLESRVAVPTESATVISAPFTCDANSNVYFRPFDAEMKAPVVKAFANGRGTLRFYVPESLRDAIVADYAVTPDGEVAILAVNGPRQGIAKFSSDGSVREKIRLNGSVSYQKIAMFPSGEFLVSGWIRQLESVARVPVVALLDQNGQFVRRVVLRREAERVKGTKKEEAPAVEEEIAGSFLQTAEDGNAYLARDNPQGPVYVISPSGAVIRTIRLNPPPDARLFDLKVAGGRIAAIYYKKLEPKTSKFEMQFRVYDSSTGSEIISYKHSSPELGLSVACFRGETFTFIGADQRGRMEILTARAR